LQKILEQKYHQKNMALLGQDPVRCQIVVDTIYLQQVKNFKYLGFEIYYENEKDTQQN